MRTTIYTRVSTDSQENENQGLGVSDYANKHDLVISSTVSDVASGSINWRERKLGNIVKTSHPGDIILVAEISRIQRSVIGVLDFLQAAAERGLIVHIIKSNLIMDGSIQSKIIATVLGLAAEIEREFIRERTTEALRRRRELGLPMGRPVGEAKTLKLDAITDDLDKWRGMGLGWAAMAKLASASRSTLYAWAERRRPEWINRAPQQKNEGA